jgi:hypothetical protein
MWKVVNYRALLHRKGMLSQAAAHNLGQKVKACLKADCLLHAKNTASNVKGCLAAGEYIEAWCHLKGWNCFAEDQAPKPCPEMLAKQSQERIDLYATSHPPGWLLPICVDPTPIPDAAPMDAELQMVVQELQNSCAAGATGMKAEHLKEWLANVKWKEWEDGGVEGLGDHWQLFVKLLQAVWTTGSVPTQMSWMIIILLPKGRGNYHGIGLLDPIWKVVEKVMLFWFSAIKLHNCLHGGIPRQGMGMAIM